MQRFGNESNFRQKNVVATAFPKQAGPVIILRFFKKAILLNKWAERHIYDKNAVQLYRLCGQNQNTIKFEYYFFLSGRLRFCYYLHRISNSNIKSNRRAFEQRVIAIR